MEAIETAGQRAILSTGLKAGVNENGLDEQDSPSPI
jgi:hypothetical protein